MTNHERYRAMMEDVCAPDALLRKVRGIPMEKTKVQMTAVRFATVAMAAVVGVFAVTNGVCYAATGETWVEKATVWVNGQPTEMDVQMSQNGDVTTGVIEYTVEDADGEGNDIVMTLATEGGDVREGTFEITDYTKEGAAGEGSLPCQVLESKDGGVLVAVEGIEPIDVTSQLAEDGVASGTCEKDGMTYAYEVSGTPGAYEASVEAQQSPAAER